MVSSFKTECPMCYGKNLYVTPQNGKKYCFNCGYFSSDGSGSSIARHDDIKGIRSLYTELSKYYHSCLCDDHRRYLNERGISDSSIERFQLGYVPNSEHVLYNDPIAVDAGIVHRNKSPFLSNRIVFPYITSNVVTDFRGRFVGNHPVKYLSPKGSAFFRGADYAFNHDTLKIHDIVVITEGDFKAAASEQAGVPCISIPGILSLRPQVKARDGQIVVACFDSQVDHAFDVFRAVQRLSRAFDSLLVATLPLRGQTKMDIDTYILQFGAEAYKRVISRAIPYTIWVKLIRP